MLWSVKNVNTDIQTVMSITIREIKPVEYPFLKEMLYQAIFVAAGEVILPRAVIEEPELKKYIHNFGQDEDLCLVAERDHMLMGAIWIRMMNGYGFVDCSTPELSMAVQVEHRGQGIGTRLLSTMIDRMKSDTFHQVSLSVDKANFAYRMYQKHGFVPHHETDQSITMICALTKV